MKEMLELRKSIKSRKPRFLRQDAHKRNRLKNNWRAPKGMDSKMRKKLRGYRKSPSLGYSSPKAVRGLNNLGLKEYMVTTLNDLNHVKDDGAVVLAKTLGMRKRIMILTKIKELGLNVLNIKDIDKYIKDVEGLRKQKKTEAKKKEEDKKKSKEESLKRAEEKKKEEDKKEKEGLEKTVDEKGQESKEDKKSSVKEEKKPAVKKEEDKKPEQEDKKVPQIKEKKEKSLKK